MSHDYSENILVQESIGKLPQEELGWEIEYANNSEQLGKNGTFGRESYKDILLVCYFRDALKMQNPWITSTQIDEAQKKFECHLSTASLMQINEEKYAIIRDGIPVTVKKADGTTDKKKTTVIDFGNPNDQTPPFPFSNR